MLDLLAFGAHPDDVELGIGGTLAKMALAGRTVAIIDLTRGEMGSNGTPDVRLSESQESSRILGCAWRRNLGLPDRGLVPGPPNGGGAAAEQVRAIVEAIRESRPGVVAIPYWQDRHPDHCAASRLLEEALFASGLRRYETGSPAWRPAKVVYYFINDAAEPSFYVDITSVYAQKVESVFAHRSQFEKGEVETRLNRAVGLPYLVEHRDAWFGARCGVGYAEGFVSKDPIVKQHLLEW